MRRVRKLGNGFDVCVCLCLSVSDQSFGASTHSVRNPLWSWALQYGLLSLQRQCERKGQIERCEDEDEGVRFKIFVSFYSLAEN
uniref:Uncharacterized protein n=1 Tax=Anguilla anguilla TaxID=7936 RepID=A0A0E9SPI4_ANGAN